MAQQMSYTDQYGENYPESYWRVEQWNFNKASAAMLLFYGYQDAAHKGGRIIGQKQYSPTPAEFETYFNAPSLDPLNNNPQAAAYTYAIAKLDCSAAGVNTPPAVNAQGVSFFQGATSI